MGTSKKRTLPFSWSYFAAGLLILLVTLWMLSGDVVVSGTPSNSQEALALTENKETKLLQVRVKEFNAAPFQEELIIRGQSEAEAIVDIVVQTSGLVVERHVQQGERVKKGALLCSLDKAAREASLIKAQAQLNRARLDYNASLKLSKRGFTSKTDLKAKEAALNAAIASVKESELDLSYTTIKAPFDGIVGLPLADIGARLAVGAPCAKLIDTTPIIISGHVSEQRIQTLKVGMGAHITLTGASHKHKGKIRYISPLAHEATRTFRVEIELNNDDLKIKSGLSATAAIQLPEQKAITLPASLLTLHDNGTLGVRGVDGEQNVIFYPIEIIRNNQHSLLVKGLPSPVKLITVGQDFVKTGEKVTFDLNEIHEQKSSNEQVSAY